MQLEKQPEQQECTLSKLNVSADLLQQLVEILRLCQEPARSSQQRFRKERAEDGRSNLICWNCEQNGHRRKDCSELRKEEVSHSGIRN